MKIPASRIFFVLTVLCLALDVYFLVAGFLDVQRQLAALAAANASGADYLNVTADALVFGVGVCSFVGLVFSAISCKTSQTRAMRIFSYIALICFSLPFLFLLACIVL